VEVFATGQKRFVMLSQRSFSFQPVTSSRGNSIFVVAVHQRLQYGDSAEL
jgi:hypothetical protein